MFAVMVEVDNSREDPELGKRGLRDELAPALRGLPGFRSLLLMTAHDKGLGVGIVALEQREQATTLAGAFPPGTEIRPGVVVVRTEVLDVAAADATDRG